MAGVFHARPSVGVTECRGEAEAQIRRVSDEKRAPMIARTIVEVFCFEHFRDFNCPPF
jgi:hypothetical protein